MPEEDKEQMPIVVCVTVGIFQENCYLYACPETLEAVIIDPGDEAERIIRNIEEYKLVPKYIINTHGHIDHICAIDAVSAVYPVPLAIHPDDVPMYTNENMAQMFNRPAPLVKRKPDILLHEGDTISFGTLTLEVLHTPGHTQGSLSLWIPEENKLIAGDTLFRDSIGRTDLPGGNTRQILSSIKTRLFELPDQTVVIPGHGPNTTIGREKKQNPFLQNL